MPDIIVNDFGAKFTSVELIYLIQTYFYHFGVTFDNLQCTNIILTLSYCFVYYSYINDFRPTNDTFH